MKGIIGAISGDIIGSRYEGYDIKTKDFELYTKNSIFTDDTIMTIAIASWLLKDTSHKTLIKELQEYGNLYPNGGYGGNFKLWLLSSNPKPYNSWGNGSAMRVSPVAWAFETLEDVEKYSKISAEVTHNHPEGIKGAQSIASAIYLGRKGKDKEFIKEYIENKYGYNLNEPLNEIRNRFGMELSCQETVPASIVAFLESENYEDTIRNAVSLGGDTDTQATIAGSIAGAYYNIPEEICDLSLNILDDKLKKVYYEFNNKYMKK